MWQLTTKEQAVILLVVAVFLTGALVKAWRAPLRLAVEPAANIDQAHGQDIL